MEQEGKYRRLRLNKGKGNQMYLSTDAVDQTVSLIKS